MDKKGILYQGLSMPKEVYLADKIEEEQESFWRPKRELWEYLDVTYFVAYAMCKNPCCQEVLEGMEEKRRDILEDRAKKYPIQSLYFWHCLGLSYEEEWCARCVIGLLQELRYGTQEEEEVARVSFWYLVCRGFHKEWEACKERKIGNGRMKIRLSKILSQKFQENGGELCSWLCMNLILCEKEGVLVAKNEGYCLFCRELKNYSRLWGISMVNRR